MTAAQAGDAAQSNFLSGLNCSQSVAAVFADEIGFDKDTVLRAAAAFGGGTCRMREMCGAVTGALMCMSLAIGSATGDKEKKDALYKAGQELCRRFKKENGSYICRELLGLVPMGQADALAAQKRADPHEASPAESSPRTAEYYKTRPCPQKCASAAKLLQEMLDEMRSVS